MNTPTYGNFDSIQQWISKLAQTLTFKNHGMEWMGSKCSDNTSEEPCKM